MAFFGLPPQYSGEFNKGTDLVSLRITRDDTGAAVALGGRRENFKVTEKKTVEMNDGIDNGGRVDHIVIPGGWHGVVAINRFNGDFDGFTKLLDAQYYAGRGQIYCTVVATINNGFDGTTSTDTYTKCVFTQPDSGDYARTKRTMVSVEFDAQERL